MSKVRFAQIDGKKYCRKCKQYLPLSEYYANKAKSDGLATWCKTCTTAYSRGERNQRYAARDKAKNGHLYPERQRRTRLLNRYGLTEASYQELFDKQHGKCAICLRSVEYKLFVDHCHTTSKVRGLLCSRCNGALGWFEKRRTFIEWYLNGKH